MIISAKDMSIIQLKAMAYDLMKKSDMVIENLRKLNTEIANREEKEKLNAERNKGRENVSSPVVNRPEQRISG